ncbi:response regulator [Lysobacter arenosi]|uniref:Response regulator n=1 Tax=Lysobacter arenosi TaxID=2795387 RepID=A0ABX7R6S4_9GAMM|nr:response regulator [Lysobacter arenosi]QSX73820.1 response regulator [Lysobacter arenosi]
MKPPIIAVVDDEESVRRALYRLLASSGFDVLVYASGRDFLRHAPSIPVDCVVLDLNLGDHSGLDVLLALSAVLLLIPVVVLTGNDTSTNRARALTTGAHAYLTKPIEDELLIDAIVSAIRSRSPGA